MPGSEPRMAVDALSVPPVLPDLRPPGVGPQLWPPAPSRRARSAPRGPPAPAPLLPDAPAIFPWLARRFSGGEATLVIGGGPAVERLLELLYAGSAKAGGEVSLVEGANRLDPYRVAETGRVVGAEPPEVLRRVRIARAFTAYQLVALVDGWRKEIRRRRPTLLVAHDLPALFAGEEVPEEAKGPLLGHVAATLRTIAETTRVPMLLTVPGGPASFPGLAERGPRLAEVVRMRPAEGALRLEAYRASEGLTLVGRPSGQRGLEEFEDAPSEEVIASWDVPLRRTGRRSRSG